MLIVFAMLAALNIIDAIQTIKGLESGLIEVNPVGRALFDKFGRKGIIAGKAVILVAALMATILLPYWYAAAVLIPLIAWGAYTTITNQMELD